MAAKDRGVFVGGKKWTSGMSTNPGVKVAGYTRGGEFVGYVIMHPELDRAYIRGFAVKAAEVNKTANELANTVYCGTKLAGRLAAIGICSINGIDST